jgi:surface-anchored protein
MTTRTLLCHLLGACTLAALCGSADAHGSHPPTDPPPPPPKAVPTYTLLDHGDVEGVGFSFLNGKLGLFIYDVLHGVEYDPSAAIVRVLDAARTVVPANASYAFLGAPGAPVWLLPQSQDEAAALGVLSLGFGADRILPGVFEGDIALRLSAVSFTPEPGVAAAGHVALFTNDALGAPTVHLDSRDGFSAADVATIAAGGHRHFNWAFSEPGLYKLTYQVNATRNGNAVTNSQVFTYRVRSAGAPFTLWSVGETLVVDGAGARIAALGLPAVHGASRAVVRAKLSGTGINASNDSAILLRADGATTVLARTRGEAPGLPGSRLKSFGNPAISSTGLVSFSAELVAGAGGVTAGNDAAFVAQYATGSGLALGIIWREGMDAPGPLDFRFTRFNWSFPSGDSVILSAQATNGRATRNGVWRVSFANGVPAYELLIMEGQPFLTDQALKTPRTIALPSAASRPGGTARAIAGDGTVALLVHFTDGSKEVLQFTAPAP